MDHDRSGKRGRATEDSGDGLDLFGRRPASVLPGRYPLKRGKRRQFDATVPGHIDQTKIPTGVYWDRSGRGHWYVFYVDAERKKKRKRIAGPEATLAELFGILESRADIDKASLGWLLDKFHESVEFKTRLGDRTRKDYDGQRRRIKAIRIKIGLLGTVSVARLTLPMMQRLIDWQSETGPTKANTMLRYLSRVFAWGMRRGHCEKNPCKGVAQAKEARLRVMPSAVDHAKILALFRSAGQMKDREKGSCAPYLWIVLELCYLLRLRPIEAITLTDAHELALGAGTNRRKGSNDNVTEWSPRLREVWDAAIALRARCTAGRPIPMRPEDRFLIVSEDGSPLKRSSLDSAFQRFMRHLVEQKLIKPEERFGLHAMKHRGITDTPGTRGQKQLASGHKTERMLDTYDHSRPLVRPSGE